MLNGNLGVVKSYLSVTSDETNRPKAFALFSFAGQCGNIIGAVAGGLLVWPAVRYPALAWGPFETFPYLLPCAVGIAMQVLVAVACACALEEPMTARLRSRGGGVSGGVPPASVRGGRAHVRKACGWLLRRRSGGARYAAVGEATAATPEPAAVGAVVPAAVGAVGPAALGAVSCAAAPAAPDGEREAELVPMLGETGGAVATVVESSPGGPEAPPVACGPRRAEAPFTLCEAGILWSTFMYGMISFCMIIFDETFPLWCSAPPERGGLGFESQDIGIAYAIVGLYLMAFVVIAVPTVTRRFGSFGMLRGGLKLLVFTLALLPCVSFLAPSRVATWSALVPLLLLHRSVTMCIWVPVLLLVNNSALAERIGAVNGLGQTICAVARGVGPIAGERVFVRVRERGL